MKEYDVIVIGSGSALQIIDQIQGMGLKTALVDKGPAGGTCLNVGCIPSKLLIAAADRVMEIREADKFGIDAQINSIDFAKIMQDMHEHIRPTHEHIRKALEDDEKLDYYDTEARFIDEYTLQVGSEKIKGDKIFIACGSRPLVPDIPGLKDYLTNESALQLEELPKSLIIIGGGYVACEFAHFFSAMGSEVTVVQADEHLLPGEEPEISELLQKELQERMTIHTGLRIDRIEHGKEGCSLHAGDIKCTGSRIFLAMGRVSNADILDVEKTGVEVDEKGYIHVDGYMETSKKNIWAFGDCIGKAMFTHAANEEVMVALHNAFGDHKHAMDYSVMPHAIFTYPSIASVGKREQDADDPIVGIARYTDVAKGSALREERGFAKAVLEDDKLVGFHIIGPHAPTLIQEVVNAMSGNGIADMARGIHIHPALPELILRTISNAR